MSPILVTGSDGYLGARVRAALEALGVTVIGLARHASDGTIGCDLASAGAVCDALAQSGAGTVIHCAAKVPKSAADYADDAAADESVAMLANLIAAEPRHIVFPSSMTVYPETAAMPVREEDAGPPGTGYAGGKRRAELALLGSRPIIASILRLPGLFGAPRRDGLLAGVAYAIASKRAPLLPSLPPVWAALHVDDAADLCARAAMGRPTHSITVNAGYDFEFSTTRAINMIARALGRPCLTDISAPCFSMNLDRLKAELGLPSRDFPSRIAELAHHAQQAAALIDG